MASHTSHRTMFLLLLATTWTMLVSGGENLLKNGNVDGKDLAEFLLDSGSGDQNLCRFSVMVEDGTWNQCAKLEFPQYEIDKNGKKRHLGALVVGGAKGAHGEDGRQALDVKPGTTYEVAFEMRGTAGMASVCLWVWEGECASAAERKTVYTSLGGGALKVSSGWTPYRGTFTTGPAAKKAALRFGVFWDETFGWEQSADVSLLVDNISIREKSGGLAEGGIPAAPPSPERKRGVLAPLDVGPAPTLDGKLDDAVWEKAAVLDGFTVAKTGEPVKAPTEGRILAQADALWIGVRCAEPEMDKLRQKHTKDGEEIWEDDCVEIFFDTATAGVSLRQFIVGAGGGRFMGWGGQTRQPKNYEDWQAAVGKGDKEWTIEIRLPYKVLGWEAWPAAGVVLPFNLCRERYAGETELSNWNQTGGNFHNIARYGVLAFGDFAPDARKLLAQAQESLRSLPEEVVKAAEKACPEARERLAQDEKKCATPCGATDWEKIQLDTAQLSATVKWAERQVKFNKLAQEPFVVTTPSPTDDVALPLMPDAIFDAPEKIECYAGMNEFESLPVLVTNLTDRPEAYRVILFGREEDGIEVPGLEGEKGARFPAELIETREAGRIKDSDEATHGYRLDPLPLMNQARTVTVPPKDSGMVWITFRVTGVPAGIYRGTLRVIPLNQSAKWELKAGKGWVYEGKAKDLPVSLTVWPIELPRDPPRPCWFMQEAANEKFYADMAAHGNRVYQLSPFYFITDVNKDGELGTWESTPHYPKLEKAVGRHLKWIDESGLKGGPKFLVGFSAYAIFKSQVVKEKLAYGSPEWRKAYLAWIRLIDQAFKKWGVSNNDYVVELWDEPMPDTQEELILTLKLAREACPTMRLQVTFGHKVFPMAKLREMEPYVDVWCPYIHLWTAEEQKAFYREMAAKGKSVWFYNCGTSLRANLYNYYRLHAWKGLYLGTEVIGLFKYTTGPGGYYGRGCWKTDAEGGLVYRSFDEPVTSIRYECLREGLDDLKYMAKLAEVVAAAKTK